MARRKAKPTGISLVKLEEGLRSGLGSAYLLLGEEDFLAREGQLAIRRAAFGGEEDSPALTVFDLAESSVGAILDEARTLPFFGGGHRVIAIERVQEMFSPVKGKVGGSKEDRESDRESLLKYLESPLDTATLVLRAPKVNKVLKATKRLLKAVTVVSCERPEARELVRWVEARARRVPFARGAAELLVERCAGGEAGLGVLAAEVEKLESLAHGQKRIDREMIASVAAEDTADGAFDLIRHIQTGDGRKSLEMLRTLLRDGLVGTGKDRIRDPRAITMMLVGALRGDLSRLWRVFSMLESGQGSQRVTEELGWQAKYVLPRARGTSRAGLVERHAALRRADFGARGGAMPLENLAELILALASIEGRSSGGGAGRRGRW